MLKLIIKKNSDLNSVRGTLCSLYCPLYNMGVIIAYVLGNYLNCFDQVLTHLILPTVFIAVLFFLPESQAFLFKHDKEMVKETFVHKHTPFQMLLILIWHMFFLGWMPKKCTFQAIACNQIAEIL